MAIAKVYTNIFNEANSQKRKVGIVVSNPSYEHNGIWVYDIAVQGEVLQAIVVRTPNGKADILQIKCRNGMLLCRAFDQELIERLSFPAAIFSAADCEAMLGKNPLYLSKAALDIGATLSMTGEQLGVLFSKA